MRVLVVGSGGREHALVLALKRVKHVTMDISCAPGNAGIARDANCVDIAAEDIEGIVRLARDDGSDLVVVGPEGPLVAGLVDALNSAGIAAFGPTKAAAQIEGSKLFAKELMAAAGVPTAKHTVMTSYADALQQIATTNYPTVMKADGLAAGKGVLICEDAAAARAAIEEFFVERRFGDTKVMLEEHLVGDEVSLLAICDGVRAIPMAPARDYKRIFDGDRGPNTGGMGSYSPVPGVGTARLNELSALVHQPIVDEMRRRGTPFNGILYAGLMLTKDGPKVLEYNARFGDPETQSILPRLESDIGALMSRAVIDGGLEDARLEWNSDFAVTITLAAGGYPGTPSTGDVIEGLGRIPDNIQVTHGGTAADDGTIVTAGGRVLNVTALGSTPIAAREQAYAAADLIKFNGRQLRSDIAAGVL